MAVNRQARATGVAPKPSSVPALTRAEERALRRSTPLTPVQFRALRQLAEHGVSPLRHI